MNTASIIILSIVLLLAGGAIYAIVSARKKGRSSCSGCSGDCSNCNIRK